MNTVIRLADRVAGGPVDDASLNARANTAIIAAIRTYPIIASAPAISLAFGIGTKSPYPRVVSVTIEK
jgi:ABC-type nitrate/sulfonate/bicarbonate transport system permease component